MAPTAYIVHQTRSRVRVKIKEKRKDGDYFEDLRSSFRHLPDEVGVRINEARGSILFLHPTIPYADLEALFQRLALFDVQEGPEPETYALSPLIAFFAKLDRAILARSAGSMDLRILVFVAALLLVIRQLNRGDVFSPALTVLWSAMDIVSAYVKNQQLNT